jgi:hypothetical protein
LFFSLLLCFLLLYLYLRKKELVLDAEHCAPETLVYAPISGKVLGIKENIDHPHLGKGFIQLRLALPFYKDLGINSPFDSEVKDLKMQFGEGYYRYSKKALPVDAGQNESLFTEKSFYSFENTEGHLVGLDFVPCRVGMSAQVWVLPGDKVKARAFIGFYPFGGSIFMYLPDYFKVFINLGDRLSSGETILAGIPDQSC